MSGNASCGNENPDIGNESTPHKVARLSAQRSEGTKPQKKTPKANDELISKNMSSNIGQMPLFNGNFHTP